MYFSSTVVSVAIVAFREASSLAVGALGIDASEIATLTVNVSDVVGLRVGNKVGCGVFVGNGLARVGTDVG